MTKGKNGRALGTSYLDTIPIVVGLASDKVYPSITAAKHRGWIGSDRTWKPWLAQIKRDFSLVFPPNPRFRAVSQSKNWLPMDCEVQAEKLKIASEMIQARINLPGKQKSKGPHAGKTPKRGKPQPILSHHQILMRECRARWRRLAKLKGAMA